ncbi:hypothetical protein K501DRAFT_330087 [Backusella circina FSU 941]|nr:hypothetical protein K501DRAFT_330087 [Backusella circina FSU 941]
MVDVLNLTCVTLERINNEQNRIDNTCNEEKGPLWTYFWNSLYSHQPSEITLLKESDISPSNSLLQLNTDVLPEESVSVAYKHKKKKNSRARHYSGDTSFTFKFTSHKHKTYRILCRPKLVDLMDAIHAKVKGGDGLSVVSYLDDEHDQIFISGDKDLEDAVDQAIKSGQTCVKLVVQNQVKTVQTDIIKSPSSLLPTAISLLGIAVTAAFICSRVSKQ